MPDTLGALWWDNNDLGVVPKTAEIGTTIDPTIIVGMG